MKKYYDIPLTLRVIISVKAESKDQAKKEKDKEVKQIINLSSKAENGIIIVKDLIKKINQKNKSKIIYLAAGKYKITLTGPDFKNLKTQINEILKEIEKQAKKQGCEFELEKTKH